MHLCFLWLIFSFGFMAFPTCLHLFFRTPHSYSSLAFSFSCPLYCFSLLHYSHIYPRSAFPMPLNTVFVCVCVCARCVCVCVRFVFRFLWVIFVSFVFLNGASVCHVQKSRGRCRLCVPLVPPCIEISCTGPKCRESLFFFNS